MQTTSGSETRNYVYDTFGRVVAEYSNQPQTGAGGLKYVSVDGQGSTRVITDASGNAVVRRDYEPYGTEVGLGVGLRTWAQKYGELEGTRQRYAGMERDANLDHTPWREYDKRGGRWTTPDPYGGSMSVGDPQSLNRYAYVGNDPVNFVDPSGLDDEFINDEKDANEHPVRTDTWAPSWSDLPSLHNSIVFLPNVSSQRRRRPQKEVTDGSDDRECHIQVRLSSIPKTSGIGVHAYIVTSDSSENGKTYFRAGPGSDDNLFAVTGPYVSDTALSPDWEKGTPPNASLTMPGSCEKYNESFKSTVFGTNDSKIPYAKLSTNSNAFAYTAVKRAGLPVGEITKVLKSQVGYLQTFPGWGIELQFKPLERK